MREIYMKIITLIAALFMMGTSVFAHNQEKPRKSVNQENGEEIK